MRISSINNSSFCGLTKNLKRQIFRDPKNYLRMYETANKPIAGSIPSDIAKKLTDEEKIEFIKALDSVSAEFSKIDDEILNEIQNISINEFMAKYQNLIDTFDYEDFFTLFDEDSLKTFAMDKFNKHKEVAQKILQKPLSRIGVQRTEIDFLGEGGFGRVYSLSFLDKNSKKIFHSKALKVYKSRDKNLEYLSVLAEKMKDYQGSDDYKKGVLGHIEFLKIFNPRFKTHFAANGVFAEANCALYVKNNVRNMMASDCIMPYIFNFKNGYGLFECSDEELGEPTKKVDLEKLGMRTSDCYRDANVVNSRVVDYGCGIK